MKEQLMTWINFAGQAVLSNSGWMTWNLFLALVPLALSFWLFQKPRSRSLFWGTLILLGATLLPNGRYIRLFLTRLLSISNTGKIYILGALTITLLLMGLDFWAKRRNKSRTLLWWLGFLVFVAFLPNAPYVLTDIIHLIDDIRQGYSVWVITLALFPSYMLFMVLGFQAYVLSLMYLGDYMKRQGWSQFILGTETVFHGLTAIGIYLGRFQRFNSWDIITKPDVLVHSVMNDLIGKLPVLVMVITFVTIAVLYWGAKWINVALRDRFEYKNPQVLA
ncbi:MAG: DUF1361 domain-containing protein [Oscillatoria sp. SIO1A7]|nr:DUF1361 domain-containing protein [Oscillatoria sp. SIO1A7]